MYTDCLARLLQNDSCMISLKSNHYKGILGHRAEYYIQIQKPLQTLILVSHGQIMGLHNK